MGGGGGGRKGNERKGTKKREGEGNILKKRRGRYEDGMGWDGMYFGWKRMRMRNFGKKVRNFESCDRNHGIMVIWCKRCYYFIHG